VLQQNLVEYHPARKFLEYTLWCHAGMPRSSAYPKFRRGALKFFSGEIDRLLVGPNRTISLQLLTKKCRPISLNPRIKTIPDESFSIMYDPQIREFVEILALLGHPSTEIHGQLNSIPFVPPFSKEAVSSYLYFFWNCNPQNGWTPQHKLSLKTFLEKNSVLTNEFKRHLKLGFGDTSRLEVVLDLELDCPADTILGELYKGFCRSVIKKNRAIIRNDTDEVEKWSRTLIRDVQVLKSMGFRATNETLVDKIQVKQPDPS
jgi:hypothetical protein